MSTDGDLPWIGKFGATLGIVALLAVVFNWQSGGQLFDLVGLYMSGEEESAASSQRPQPGARSTDDGEPTDQQISDALGGSRWDCYYDPSMNDDWHDDFVCRRGFDSFRPILLPDQGFVTENDMVIAGEDYELELNGDP